ncbi:MAG: hypothetical protein KGI37_11050 [Alphaproteobacteria bacterium]|nr:hypothetical protein [Alphaproteobacteria bacterium]
MTQIDDSGCLSSDADTASSANNGHVVAHCCIVQVPSSAQCALYCSTSG